MTTNEEILNRLDLILAALNEVCGHMKADDEQLVSITRAAAILGKSVGAVRQMVHRGQLNCTKLSNGRLAFEKGYLLRSFGLSAEKDPY